MAAMTTVAPTGGTRVRIDEPLDRRAAPDIRQVLLTAVVTGDGPIVLDLTGSSVLDSTGFALLVSAHVRAAHRGRPLRITGADERTRRLLRRAGLRRLIADAPGRPLPMLTSATA